MIEVLKQEPVAYINVEKRILEWAKLTSWETPTVVNLPKIPLYTHPPQRTEPVCPECKAEVLYECVACSRNNYPPQRTEPPDWFPAVENILNEYGLQAIDFVADFKAAMKDAEKSQRTWVGLTDEEIDGITCVKWEERGQIRAIEAKLKEKNT